MRRGKIIEINEATNRGYVACIEPDVVMSTLHFEPDEHLALSADLVGRECTFEIGNFWGDVRACNVKLASSDVPQEPEPYVDSETVHRAMLGAFVQ